ncbi:flavin reductase (DIM6/NTAB) family NADH-FMN oxidoreductase RutF [Saccharothrix carnea]|uniref:Flavin reductase (DIM6/NTAB) family NADH-FMN oxidoreductase RutF n=1 Tax=Saccharothrix carnea TaxID=1280637 RepID=A0A2P8IBK6_SACCR|nr:flavin reductase family protein [Saccharothrix carnea]PSL55842.1 flavin reductase (DIM6/NTAB) family NADH-FMN oxidoreductase RutF [Saccharothrix carnea]
MSRRPAGAETPSPQHHDVDVRRLMVGFPTGVSVVTAQARDGRPWGMTCTSLCSVAPDPPSLLVCLRRGSPTLDAVLGSSALAVNLLHRDARSTAELFASGAPDRFERVPWLASDGGPHLTDAAHTIADCAVSAGHAVGDHVVVLAEIVRITSLRTPAPLLYGMRRYGAWAEDADAAALSSDFTS